MPEAFPHRENSAHSSPTANVREEDVARVVEMLMRSVLPEHLAGVTDKTRAVPRARNPRRRDFGSRFEFTVTGENDRGAILVLAPGLENLAGHIAPLQAALPSVVARTLAHGRVQEFDYVLFEQLPGESLESRLASHPEETDTLLTSFNAFYREIEASGVAASREEVEREIEELFQQILEFPVWSEIDRRLLRDAILSKLKQDVLAHSTRRRWTNGDFTASNILVGPDGRFRLIDYEFATQTCLHYDDACRFFRVSKLTEAFLNHPRLELHAAIPLWAEAISTLRFLINFSAVMPVDLIEPDVRFALRVIMRYATQVDPSWHGSQILGYVAGKTPFFPVWPYCELSWSNGGLFHGQKFSREHVVWRRKNDVRFLLRPDEGTNAATFSPINCPARIELRDITCYDTAGLRRLHSVSGRETANWVQAGSEMLGPLGSEGATFFALGNESQVKLILPAEALREPVLVLSISFELFDDLVALKAALPAGSIAGAEPFSAGELLKRKFNAAGFLMSDSWARFYCAVTTAIMDVWKKLGGKSAAR